MNDYSLNTDKKVLPLVHSIKDKPIKSNKLISKVAEDISSEKTSGNTPKMENEELKSSRNDQKRTKSLNKLKTINRRFKPNNTIRKNIKISIDAEAEPRKSVISEKNVTQYQNNKILIISKDKEPKFSSSSNKLNIFSGGQLTQKKFNNIKTRSKYVQNLLNDMSIKKYTQTCIDLLKNDNLIKKLYEQCGFEKTNYNYENFIQKNFFNKALFMYKLEMLFLEESNFIKKNFKENFFKSEIVKYLNEFTNEEIYKRQMTSLKDVFNDGFEAVINFDLFHD